KRSCLISKQMMTTTLKNTALLGANDDDEWWLAWKYSFDKMNFKNFREGNTAKLGNPVFREEWITDVTTDVVELLRQFSAIFPVSK
ncbi:hypothetical protein OA9_0017470, partial [Vibrio cyclitrophicus 1F97]